MRYSFPSFILRLFVFREDKFKIAGLIKNDGMDKEAKTNWLNMITGRKGKILFRFETMRLIFCQVDKSQFERNGIFLSSVGFRFLQR